jgi:hypothetical protein
MTAAGSATVVATAIPVKVRKALCMTNSLVPMVMAYQRRSEAQVPAQKQ